MDVVYGLLLGLALASSAVAAIRFAQPHRVMSPQGDAMQAALHAASATLPHLRRGLSRTSAAKAAPHLLTLVQAQSVAIADNDEVLAFAGAGEDHHAAGDALDTLVAHVDERRAHVSGPSRCDDPACPLGAAVAVPLTVQDRRVGVLAAFFADTGRVRPEHVRVVQEVGSLVSAQIALAELAMQGERLARAELLALRAQISPHFVYNALTAVANSIHEGPEEARELLTDFGEFIRYAFRSERPYVTLQDELHYVGKYLRLEEARFGDGLQIRVEVAPDVLPVVVPALSLQPLVENAIRHGIEPRGGRGQVTIVATDSGADVELRVTDSGPGMPPERIGEALEGRGREGNGGIGLANVNGRLKATFGPSYGLELRSELDRGTTVTMTVPKFRAGVRAA
ncbi:MAG TPA: histidine kinase [Gaiellaceae bacterium]|jgi:two-component system LytT family sensor kinase|nr:histidine kinase [Gaiellaceae bacterium]